MTDSEGKRIYSAAQTGKGEELTIYVSDGWIRAQVTDSAIRDTEQIERGQVNRSV